MSLCRALDGISGILVTPFDNRDQLTPSAQERLTQFMGSATLLR